MFGCGGGKAADSLDKSFKLFVAPAYQFQRTGSPGLVPGVLDSYSSLQCLCYADELCVYLNYVLVSLCVNEVCINITVS